MTTILPIRYRSILFPATLLVLSFAVQVATAQQANVLKWKVQRLAVDANEGIDIADFNRDGKLDIVAGRNWYAAPDFAARPLRHIEDWNGYVESNGDYAYDVDKDGFTDFYWRFRSCAFWTVR